MKDNGTARIGLSAGLVLFVGACAGPRMAPPNDVSKASRSFEAQDRSRASGMLVNEAFKLGDYQIGEVDRDATSKSGFSVGGYGKSKTTTGYTYQVKVGDRVLRGGCGSQAKEQGFAMSGSSSVNWGSVELTCQCDGDAGHSDVKLAGKSKTSEGTLNIGDVAFNVSPVMETQGSNFTGTIPGFRVDGGSGPIGAVETLYPGKVWLANGVDEAQSDHLSCLFVGLMLYVPPSDH